MERPSATDVVAVARTHPVANDSIDRVGHHPACPWNCVCWIVAEAPVGQGYILETAQVTCEQLLSKDDAEVDAEVDAGMELGDDDVPMGRHDTVARQIWRMDHPRK